jgi:Zn-dependent peptidase ImmA (M78 family)
MIRSRLRSEAARDASKLLAEAGLRFIPVDPANIARVAGLSVTEEALDSRTMGVLVKRPGHDPEIVINKNDSRNRRRFTCAHELGHYVRRREETEEYATFDLRGSLSSTGTDEEEVYANEFAACLLMPENEVRRLRDEGFADWEMAIRFAVSREAVQYRLRGLNLS